MPRRQVGTMRMMLILALLGVPTCALFLEGGGLRELGEYAHADGGGADVQALNDSALAGDGGMGEDKWLPAINHLVHWVGMGEDKWLPAINHLVHWVGHELRAATHHMKHVMQDMQMGHANETTAKCCVAVDENEVDEKKIPTVTINAYEEGACSNGGGKQVTWTSPGTRGNVTDKVCNFKFFEDQFTQAKANINIEEDFNVHVAAEAFLRLRFAGRENNNNLNARAIKIAIAVKRGGDFSEVFKAANDGAEKAEAKRKLRGQLREAIRSAIKDESSETLSNLKEAIQECEVARLDNEDMNAARDVLKKAEAKQHIKNAISDRVGNIKAENDWENIKAEMEVTDAVMENTKTNLNDMLDDDEENDWEKEKRDEESKKIYMRDQITKAIQKKKQDDAAKDLADFKNWVQDDHQAAEKEKNEALQKELDFKTMVNQYQQENIKAENINADGDANAENIEAENINAEQDCKILVTKFQDDEKELEYLQGKMTRCDECYGKNEKKIKCLGLVATLWFKHKTNQEKRKTACKDNYVKTARNVVMELSEKFSKLTDAEKEKLKLTDAEKDKDFSNLPEAKKDEFAEGECTTQPTAFFCEYCVKF